MRFTALSVPGSRRIGMGVRRLLIWGVRGRICFIRRRVFGISEVDGGWLGFLLLVLRSFSLDNTRRVNHGMAYKKCLTLVSP